MTVKEHYDHHLAHFYSWMIGNFETSKNTFLQLCKTQNIFPLHSKKAIDLGTGNGIQSVALAELGFHVTAIDFNDQLLGELRSKKKDLSIDIINDDLTNIKQYAHLNPELIICCGDTITHLSSEAQIKELIKDCFETLGSKGKIMLSFRDYSIELTDTARFIPVKSEENRILTCFLEYFPDKVRVTDLFYEMKNDKWEQKVSSYEKVRISGKEIEDILVQSGFKILLIDTANRLITIIGEKNH